jgi:hypothetical protein
VIELGGKVRSAAADAPSLQKSTISEKTARGSDVAATPSAAREPPRIFQIALLCDIARPQPGGET